MCKYRTYRGNRNTKLLEKEKLDNLGTEGRISSRHYRVFMASYVKKERGATNRPYTNQTKRFEVGHGSFFKILNSLSFSVILLREIRKYI